MMIKRENENIVIKVIGGIIKDVCPNISEYHLYRSIFGLKSFIAALLCFISLSAAEAQAGENATNKSCEKASCDSIQSSCKPNLGILASSNHLNAKCLKDSADGGCFNPVPVGCTVNYSGVGNRPNGAGGNSKPRYHLGNDIGSAGCSNAPGKNYKFINVYAAADGVVSYQKTSGCGGRTIAINHDKGCKGGKEPQYKTIYRHLLQYRVSNGSKVKKGDVIGIMGGSNSASIGAEPCDNPDQQGAPGYQHSASACSAASGHCGGASYYKIHAHFEIADGGLAAGAGSGISGQPLYKPDCDNIQQLCGGCPTSAGKCHGSTQGVSDGTSGDTNGTFIDEGDYEYTDPNAPPTCVYTPYLDSQNCVFCGLFKTMFNTASQVALMADVGLMEPTLNLVKIGFLIWLAVYLLKQLASFNATNSGELAKGILFQGFRVAVIALILSSQTNLFRAMDLTLNPVMMTGLKFTEALSGEVDCNKDAEYMQNIMGYNSAAGYSSSEKPTGGLSTEIGESLICNIKKMEDATGLFMALGKFSVCLSFNTYPWGDVLPHLGYLTTGIFLWLAGLALLLTFPWCLVDCVLQLCIAAALIPCAIGTFAFKITSKYLKIVWNFFMNAMFNFVFMALIIYIINKQLLNWIGLKSPEAVQNDHTIFIRFDGLAWYGMGFIRVAAICFFCYVLFDEAKSMAEKFADSPSLGGSKGIGRMVGGTVVGAAGQAGAASLSVTVKTAKAAGSGINLMVGNQYRSIKNNVVGRLASRFGKNGTVSNVGGKTVAREGSFRLFGRDIKFSATKDEDGRWNLTKEIHKRSQSDKVFEKVLDKYGNEVKDENGNVKYRARKRVLGITTGYEDMVATKDADGNLVYTSIDSKTGAEGKSQFHMDQNGQISSYKTRFTRAYFGMGEVREKENIQQYGTNRTVSTPTSLTRENIDSHGNVTDSQIDMLDFNLFNRDLVRKDGTINIDTFNEMQKSIGDPKRAAQALVSKVMEKRGLKLDNKYADRTVDIDDNGRVTIKQTQKDNEGNIVETQNIQAVMIGDQMFIACETTDKDGNLTLNESNGILRTTQTVTKDKNGHFNYDFNGNFSEYTLNKNSYISPLNYQGKWGNNIDRDKAMAGFTQSHYDKYLAKLKIQQIHRTTDAGTYRNSEEVKRLNGMIQAKSLDSLEEAKQNMTYAQEVAKKK